MSKRIIGNVIATLFGIGAALVAMWASRIMRQPDGLFDWIVLLLAGLVAGTLIFFITWGHFQDAPVPPKPSAE